MVCLHPAQQREVRAHHLGLPEEVDQDGALAVLPPPVGSLTHVEYDVEFDDEDRW